jgi:uncharacterized protein
VIVLDTSGVYAAVNENQPEHDRVKKALEAEEGPLFLSPFVLAEVDYLVADRAGVDAELAVLRQVVSGAFNLFPFNRELVGEASSIIEQYRDLGIGLADASNVVLARILETRRILTLDERHFRAVRTHDGEPFTLLPADV